MQIQHIFLFPHFFLFTKSCLLYIRHCDLLSPSEAYLLLRQQRLIIPCWGRVAPWHTAVEGKMPFGQPFSCCWAYGLVFINCNYERCCDRPFHMCDNAREVSRRRGTVRLPSVRVWRQWLWPNLSIWGFMFSQWCVSPGFPQLPRHGVFPASGFVPICSLEKKCYFSLLLIYTCDIMESDWTFFHMFKTSFFLSEYRLFMWKWHF
jgi:hypothetical protein